VKALIVSDTHGRHENFERVLKKVGEVDMVIHAGDVEEEEEYFQKKVSQLSCDGRPVELHMVRGNCDTFTELPANDVFMFGERMVFLAHGHRYFVGGGCGELADAAETNGCDIAIYGHTHVPDYHSENGITVINPGSLERPRQDGRRPSFALMELDSRGNLLVSICLLGADGNIIVCR